MFKEIEVHYQLNGYNQAKAAELLKELKKLQQFAKQNDKRFIQLNKDYLQREELIEINRRRNQKMDILYVTVNRQTQALKKK